tara:strand:+ start:297 stop:2174 length:1878 start_codon:yes stop_codon:yes gene_type:complete
MGLVTLLEDGDPLFKYYSSKGYTSGGDTPGMKSIPYPEGQKPLITFDINNNGKSDVKFPDFLSNLGDIGGDFGGDNSEDFLIRGGIQSPLRAGIDVSRLERYLLDTKKPSGLLFTAKQNLLSRIAVKTEASRGAAYLFGATNEGVYTPLSTLAQAGVGFLGTHLNKQGLDPTGLLGFLSIKKYEDVIKQQTINNSSIELTDEEGNLTTDNRLLALTSLISRGEKKRRFNGQNGYTLNIRNSIIEYGGGPNSVLGVGKTKITFADNRINIENFKNDSITKNPYSTYSSLDLLNQPLNLNFKIQEDFRKTILLGNPKAAPIVLSTSPNYVNQNIEQRLGLGNPGARGNRLNYTQGKKDLQGRKLVAGENSDKLTLQPIYKSEETQIDDGSDLCVFRIAIIDPESPKDKFFLHFRAFINKFGDGYKASWKGQKYMGRAEELYKYGGFNRDISIDFTVVAQSKEELIPMHQKLNFLASTLAPTYTKSGYMAGNLSQMTVGGYLYEQPGFIESLSFDIPQEIPWEIGIDTEGEIDNTVKQLPHLINVSLKFQPIHKFRPAINSIDLDDFGIISYGQERYIALENGEGNNYGRTTQDIQVEQQAAVQESLEEQAAQEIVVSTALGLTPLGY